MDRLVFAAAIAILGVWVASVIVSLVFPSRGVNPSVQIAMVALTTFLFGTVWTRRR